MVSQVRATVCDRHLAVDVGLGDIRSVTLRLGILSGARSFRAQRMAVGHHCARHRLVHLVQCVPYPTPYYTESPLIFCSFDFLPTSGLAH